MAGLSVSRSMGQPLTHDTANHTLSALNIVDTKSDAVAVPEAKFAEITVQVVLGAVLVYSLHAALENREVSLNGVGMSESAHPFLCGMVDGFMGGKPLSDIAVSPQFVGHQSALGVGVLEDCAPDVIGFGPVEFDRTSAPFTLDNGKHRVRSPHPRFLCQPPSL